METPPRVTRAARAVRARTMPDENEHGGDGSGSVVLIDVSNVRGAMGW